MTDPEVPQQVQMMSPQPSPETWSTNVHESYVIVSIMGVSGQHVSFLEASNAETIGQQLIDAARRARTGLIIPPLNGSFL